MKCYKSLTDVKFWITLYISRCRVSLNGTKVTEVKYDQQNANGVCRNGALGNLYLAFWSEIFEVLVAEE